MALKPETKEFIGKTLYLTATVVLGMYAYKGVNWGISKIKLPNFKTAKVEPVKTETKTE